MEDYMKRVCEEFEELNDRVDKLQTKVFETSGGEKSILGEQLEAMCKYRDILAERIGYYYMKYIH